MKNVVGFTLIELVVVIVILGILAVTAAPKFLGLQVDARNAALKGLEGTLKSALGVGYSKMAILGVENSPYATNRAREDNEKESLGIFSVNMSIIGCPKNDDTNQCVFQYGYPQDPYTFNQTIKNVGWRDSDSGWTYFYKGSSIIFTFKNNVRNAGTKKDPKDELINDNCYIIYTPPTKINEQYTITLNKCR